MSQSPPKPWTPGVQPNYTAFRLVVNICQDRVGNVWSDHTFLTSEDEMAAQGLTHGGVLQVGHALLTEAVRYEVFTSALVKMSSDPTLLTRWTEQPAQVEAEIAAAVKHVLIQTIEKMLPHAVPGVLTMLHEQQSGTKADPQE